MPDNDRILVLGYGNPGRRDDGLGPAFAAALERLHLPGVTVDSDYQLTVEDAAAVAQHDIVLFVDADASGPEPFLLQAVAPSQTVTFSSHSVGPDSVLALVDEIYAARPEAYVLGIRGYEFDEFCATLDEASGENLSPGAQANLDAALRFLVPVLRERCFRAVAARSDGRPAASAASKGVADERRKVRNSLCG